jgi:small subunit ribosomal protein S10e
MVVKKDTRLPKHPEITVANLAVMNVMKSLKSRGYVTEEFNWGHHYFYLSDEGILFLRNYLHMPETVVPATIAKGAARRSGPRDVREEGQGQGESSGRRQEGGEYRRGGAWRGRQQQGESVAAH